MTQSHQSLLRGLKAAAEPSRLRLLGVLALGEFTVSELTGVLGQSQPRVSRHLKLLHDGGLLERFREQHWVFHRVPASGEGAALVRSLLALLDPDDALPALDRERANAALAERARVGVPGLEPADTPSPQAASNTDLADLLVAELGRSGYEAILYSGPAPAEMLHAIGPRARRVVGVCESRHEVQKARASLHSGGLAHCELQHGDLPGAAPAAASFDAVVLDRVLGPEARRGEWLRVAARVLRPGGRLLIVEDYDAVPVRAGSGNALATLRGWMAEEGFACERLRPADAGELHVIMATASAGRVEQVA